jgi:hypothetical protein
LKIAGKPFAKEFKRQYPNVYSLILRWKEPLNYVDTKAILSEWGMIDEGMAYMNKPETALPNLMMRLESVIFRDILKSLFAKRICAVHIHDAIVVPTIKSTEKVDANLIVDVMRNAYKKQGLYPSFKVETYSKK